MKVRKKADARRRIHYRIRQKVQGTETRPRLSVFRSLKHLYVQAIDDATGRTLAAASSRETGLKDGSNKKGAAEVGKLIASRCRDKGIESVVFDRGGFKYHGRIQVLADAAREAGLKM
ncbi:MAG TPA: 50S ribosomal protein L18 [Vicinamibacteria bacterium]|nr:50S ribosomal protein L18 [Vicinamibacteria bacterium]